MNILKRSSFKIAFVLLVCFGLLIETPHFSYAADGPSSNPTEDFVQKIQNQTNQNNPEKIKPTSVSDISSSAQGFVDKVLPMVYHFVIDIFILMFLLGIIGMSYSMTTKNGQMMKWSTRSMFGSLIGFVLVRIVPIFVLTTNANEINMIVSDIVSLTKSISFYAAIGMVLIGFAMKLLYRIVSHHPEYYKWSKSLFIGAIILGVLSFVAPMVFRSI